MRGPAAFVAFCLVYVSALRAEVVKVDLRTAPAAQDFFLAFCGPSANPRTAFVATAQGNLTSGYDWSEITPFGLSRAHRQSAAAERSMLDSCIKGAFTSSSPLLIAQLDEKAFKEVQESLRSQSAKGESSNVSVDFMGLVSELAKLSGLQAPSSAAAPSELIGELSRLNPGQDQNGVEWIWQPPIVRVVTRRDSAIANSAPPISEEPSNSYIPTGLKSVPNVDRLALETLYQALADAEDHPSDYYDVELRIEDDAVKATYVHPVQAKRDPETEKGDSLCIFLSGDTKAIDPVELVDSLLLLGITDAPEVSASWGFDPAHPMFGTPRNWQAAATSPPACYLLTTPAAQSIARIAPTRRMVYATTLIRGFARYPKDKAIFNSKAPVSLSLLGSKPKSVTPSEYDWRAFRSYVEQLHTYAERRAGTYPGLGAGEINKRRAYALAATKEDDLFWAIRQDFSLRERGWHQYIYNKYKGRQEDDLNRYSNGIPTFYSVMQDDNKQLEDGWADLSPFLRKEMDDFQQLMAVSALGKDTSDIPYQSDLTPTGKVCEVQKAYCSKLRSLIQPNLASSLKLGAENNTQAKFDNILDIGVFSVAKTQAEDWSSFTPPNGVCKTRDPGLGAARTAGTSIKLSLTNQTTSPVNLSLAYVGSWVRAHWDTEVFDGWPRKAVQPGDTATVNVDFTPGTGYEDLNLIYILQDTVPLAQITINYDIVDDPTVKVFQAGTPGLQGGANEGWIPYKLGVSQVPPMYTVRKACVWVAGDRNDCLHTKWTTCSVAALDDNSVLVDFAFQGHHEDPNARRASSGYMWVGYELTSYPVKLH